MDRGRRTVGGELLALGAMTAVSGVALMLARDLRGRGDLRDEWTIVGGRRMFARAGGSLEGATKAVPIVLVHGYGMSSRYMIPMAVRLLPQFAVHAPDLPGHGRSENHGRPLRVEELADALVGWMDATGIDRASLVGHSFGCQVVANVAARYHTRVDRIVLVAPVADPRAATISQQFRRLLVSALAERITLGLLLALDYTLAGPNILVDELRELVGYRIADDLTRIIAPSMVVRGTRDAIVPDRWARRVAKLLHAERYAVVRNGGHALNYSAPNALVDAVRPFLTEARTARLGDRLPFPADDQ
jgi:pimeloyl-ACP methyl ester carboxylesterase